MKVKIDFVTNSSSTAYVFFLPSNYVLDGKYVNELADEWWGEYDDGKGTIEDYKKMIVDSFEQFKKDKVMWHDDNYQVYAPIQDILAKHGQELISIDIDSSSGQIHLIDVKHLKEMVAIEELITMKGELNVTETQKQ